MLPDSSIHGLMIKSARLYFVRAFHLLERLGLHPGQVPLLVALYREDGLSQKELVKRLSVKPSTVAVMIKRMERNGLLLRRLFLQIMQNLEAAEEPTSQPGKRGMPC